VLPGCCRASSGNGGWEPPLRRWGFGSKTPIPTSRFLLTIIVAMLTGVFTPAVLRVATAWLTRFLEEVRESHNRRASPV